MTATTNVENLIVTLKCENAQYKKEMAVALSYAKTFAKMIERDLGGALKLQQSLTRQAAGGLATLTSQSKQHVATIAKETTAISNQTKAQQAQIATLKQLAAANTRAVASASAGALGGGGRAGTSLLGVGGRMLGGAAGTAYRYGRRGALLAGAGIGGSIASYATLEDSATRAAAVAGDNSAGFRKSLMGTARSIGTTGLLGTHDVARGLLEASQAGINLKSSINQVRDASRFAIAGSLSLSQSIDTLATSSKALGMEGPKAFQQVADAIVKASNMTTASIADLGAAVTNKSAAAARAYGKDLYELIGVLSAYHAAGVKGQVAGSQTFMLWRDLQSAANKNSAAWKYLGMAAYDSAGKLLRTDVIVGQLEKTLAGMTDQQKKQTLAQLGLTDRSQGAMLTLLGYSGAMRDYTNQVRAATGESNKLATQIESSLLSQMRILWNQCVELSTVIGEHLAPYTRVAVEWLQKLTTSISAALKVSSEAEAIRKLSDEFTRMATVAGAVFSEVVSFIDQNIIPQMLSVAEKAGSEFATGFWNGFTNSGTNWQEKLKTATENKAIWEKGGRGTGNRARQYDEAIRSFEEEIAAAKTHLGLNAGPSLQARLGNIVKSNYGVTAAAKPATSAGPAGFVPSTLNLAGYRSGYVPPAMQVQAPTFTRPNVPVSPAMLAAMREQAHADHVTATNARLAAVHGGRTPVTYPAAAPRPAGEVLADKLLDTNNNLMQEQNRLLSRQSTVYLTPANF